MRLPVRTPSAPELWIPFAQLVEQIGEHHHDLLHTALAKPSQDRAVARPSVSTQYLWDLGRKFLFKLVKARSHHPIPRWIVAWPGANRLPFHLVHQLAKQPPVRCASKGIGRGSVRAHHLLPCTACLGNEGRHLTSRDEKGHIAPIAGRTGGPPEHCWRVRRLP